MARDGTLGSMLQGVSQQPPAVRPAGKVTEQINYQSDVVEGLSARPALHERATIINQADGGLSFIDFEVEGTEYLLGYSPTTAKVWSTDGTEQTLITEGNSLAYIGQSMRPYVFEDRLYLSNRDTVVATDPTIDTSSVFTNVGLVTMLGGLFSRTYSVEITWQNGTTTKVGYLTPTGELNGDANETRASYIAEQLYNGILLDANLPAGAVTGLSESVFFVHDPSGPFTLVVDDDDNQTAIRAHTATTNKLENLAKTAPHGTLVKVTGDDAGPDDDYYLRFKSSTETTVGLGFGKEGIWEEWYNPNEGVAFDLTTMPHIIEKTGATEFTLKQGDWLARRVGDEESNPFPDFVGYPIRDIGGFQSRLVFVAGPNCVMSQTNQPTDFFKKSALSELDTDPIGVSSTQEGTTRLDWIIPFDRDLVLMSDPGKGQYIITGNTKLTPDTASLVKTTAFEMRGGAKPVETGRTILFPFKSGKFSGIKEFFTNDEVTTNGADTLTETADRYISGLVTSMKCSTNFSMAMFGTDDAAFADTLWVYKYLWQNTEKLQSAWYKWTFPGTVRHYFFSGSELYVVLSEDGYTEGTTNYIFTALDLDIPADPVADYHISLDRQHLLTADVSNEVTLPFLGASFVQSTGCATPGRPVSPTASVDNGSGGTYTFDADTVPEGAQVVGGLRYTRSLSPTMPFIRDRNGDVAPRTHLVVGSFILEYEKTGYIKAIMDSRYRQLPIEFEMDWFPVDNDPIDPLGNGLRSGKLNIPWGERTDWSQLTLTSDDVRPTTIIELEWVGQAFKGDRG